MAPNTTPIIPKKNAPTSHMVIREFLNSLPDIKFEDGENRQDLRQDKQNKNK
jgi:hypothetical protein